MKTIEEILKHREEVSNNILKSFGEDIDIEKARSGIYADNPENRRLNRVGQKYGETSEKQETNEKQTTGGKTIEEHAKNASDEALKKVISDDKAPENLKSAAKKELENRSKSEGTKSEEKPREKKIQEEINEMKNDLKEYDKTGDSEKFVKKYISYLQGYGEDGGKDKETGEKYKIGDIMTAGKYSNGKDIKYVRIMNLFDPMSRGHGDVSGSRWANIGLAAEHIKVGVEQEIKQKQKELRKIRKENS